MYRQKEKEKEKVAGTGINNGLPFKVAVFICGGLPLDVVENLGGVVGKECWEWDERNSKDLHTLAGALVDLKPGQDPNLILSLLNRHFNNVWVGSQPRNLTCNLMNFIVSIGKISMGRFGN